MNLGVKVLMGLIVVLKKFVKKRKLNFLAESKIMSSKSEARRAIANNGLKLNNKLIKDEKNIKFR